MSASKTLGSNNKKLGIIAGAGDLPARLADVCEEKGIEVFIIAIENQTNPKVVEGRNHLWESISRAGKIIKTLKNHDVQDLVLIGAVRRPSFSELKPDLKTAEFFARVGLKALGDSDLLSALKQELQNEGFTIHSIQDFAEELLVVEGDLGKYGPSKKDQKSIEYGIKASQVIGWLDIGQSVIVQQGVVVGVEGVEGTDALIQRCQALLKKGQAGILIKTCKPQQDQSLDLPTIGPKTVKNCIDTGLGGIIIQAKRTLVVDQENLIQLANKHKFFVTAKIIEND